MCGGEEGGRRTSRPAVSIQERTVNAAGHGGHVAVDMTTRGCLCTPPSKIHPSTHQPRNKREWLQDPESISRMSVKSTTPRRVKAQTLPTATCPHTNARMSTTVKKTATAATHGFCERGEVGQGPDSSVGGGAVVNRLGVDHMEEEVQDRVQVEVGKEDQGVGETHGKEQSEEQRENRRSINRTWMTVSMG